MHSWSADCKASVGSTLRERRQKWSDERNGCRSVRRASAGMAYRPVSKTGGLHAHEGSTPSSPTQMTPALIFVVSAVILFSIILAFFLSRRLSPIPYFPSNREDIPLIVKSLKLKNHQTVYDLGAGDGVVIFAAARTAFGKKLNTKFIAVEINPFLLFYMYVVRLFHPNRKKIEINRRDIFTMNFSVKKNVTIFMYISPWYMERVYTNICRSISAFHFVSYFYALPASMKIHPKKVVDGVHTLYEY